MVAGHDLKEGQYDPRQLNSDEIWQNLSIVFTSRSRNSTSYKYGFLKAILDNLYNVNEELVLTFDQLFSKFAEIYWNLVTKYKVEQMPGEKTSAVETVLRSFVVKEHIAEGVPFEKSNAFYSLEDTDYYIGFYVDEREKGHSRKWAHLYARYFVLEGDEEFALKDTVEELEEDEKERELEIHANTIKDVPELIGSHKSSIRKKTHIQETMDMMFPEGIDDGFSLPED